MQEIFLIRHGETDWNVQKRMQGQTKDVPLNAQGIAQAEAAALTLSAITFNLIVASPLDRAAHTAQIIAREKQIAVHYDERLIERGLGEVEGKTMAEYCIERNIPVPEQSFTQWMYEHCPHGAETIAELQARASDALHGLLQQHADKKLLIVTHGAWMRALIQHLGCGDMAIHNAVPFVVRRTGTGWRVNALPT